MARKVSASTITQNEDEEGAAWGEEAGKEAMPPPIELAPAKQPIIWRNVIGLLTLHVVATYTLIRYLLVASALTIIFNTLYGFAGALGITAGAHRLWAHRSYSAKLPLRIFLALLFCIGGQTHLSKWIRDHRTHHRYTDTSADPHDSSRGFFFSHVGWLMVKRHPFVRKYGSKIDMSDLRADPVIRFFDRFYPIFMIFMCFVLPSLVPVRGWNESWKISILAALTRYVIALNVTFSVNSFAHMSGNRPYNRHIRAVENLTVSLCSLGEGWHNYHHTFPWDYKAAELGFNGLNFTAAFIRSMAVLGLSYDLKTSSAELVEKTVAKKGDVATSPRSTSGATHRDGVAPLRERRRETPRDSEITAIYSMDFIINDSQAELTGCWAVSISGVPGSSITVTPVTGGNWAGKITEEIV